MIRDRARRWVDAFMTVLFSSTGAVAIVFIFLIFLFTFKEALPVFTDPEVRKDANLAQFFVNAKPAEHFEERYVWQPTSEQPKMSMIPLLLGTFKSTFIALLFACPVGVAAALFSSEFASRRMREIVKPVVELLAGIPSVVLGFFALLVLASWLQSAFHFTYRLNAYNAGLALGIALLPIIFTISEDGLAAVPRGYREASMALGATRVQTAIKVVLPAAVPAVFAAFVLAFGRAIGETMILLMAGGNAAIASFSLNDPLRTLSATIAAELGEVVFGSAHYAALFFIGTLLFAITFISNSLGNLIIAKMRRRMQGDAA
ncbi:MAG: phosphate ABC transporter permease subunit PstC [Acidobacteria bacterium]|nr:phosphate ABC transporter permease subunit PstC [Acidobacteriota bacterium]MBV9475358.1 phosphate ABC transporter permease subunit PstC [Acidobacteriota bacterium]